MVEMGVYIDNFDKGYLKYWEKYKVGSYGKGES